MKILIISQYFWPEDFRINDLCSELVRRGNEVTVLTAKPNYPGGQIYADFRNKPAAFAFYAGAKIVRVPIVPRGNARSFQLILNYVSFALSASLWGWIKLRKTPIDVIFVYEPSPVTVGLPAIFLKKMRAIPVVFWVLDLWPETLRAVGVVRSERILNLVGRLVSFIYNRCDLVLGQSKAFVGAIEKNCSDSRKIKYFPSWSEDIFANTSTLEIREIAQFDESFKLLFAGNVGEAQDFPAIIAMAKVLKARQANVILFIVGDGRMLNWLKQSVETQELGAYVRIMGRFPLQDMPAFYTAADALLVSLKRSQIFAMTIPGKVQSYLMSGKPVLGMLDGEGAQVIETAKAGYSCAAGDYEALADNVLKMSYLDKIELAELGKNARNYAHAEFDRGRLITQLESWLDEQVEKQQIQRGTA